MRNTRLVLGFLVTLASAGSTSFASEEEYLHWRSLRLDFGDHPQVGKAALAATAGDAGITAFEITAFGESHKLAASDLAKLRGFGLDGLRVTHETGYPERGGHTVYFRLRRIYYSASEKRAVEEVVTVSVSKGRGLAVSEPQERR